MPDKLHEHMNLYLEAQASLDPKCMRCGAPAHWQLQGVDPVRVPVYSDPPPQIPLRRWPHEAHKPRGEGTMPWLGFQVHLALLTADNVLQSNQFIDSQLINHPDLVRITVEGMGRELVEALRGRTDAAPPE